MIHDGLDEIIGWDESLLEWMHNYLNESPPWEHYEWFNHPNFWFLLTSRSLKLTHRTKTHTHTKTHTPCKTYTRTFHHNHITNHTTEILYTKTHIVHSTYIHAHIYLQTKTCTHSNITHVLHYLFTQAQYFPALEKKK